ncbi:ferritin [Corynebacterium sp. H128]|uniref:ferritin n=1 Tax=unclassified Corynebacterium TaxID=2624378 RepID=UPI0030A60EF2
MKINDKLAAALNEQVTAELEAALVYLQLSYVVDGFGLAGIRDWLRAQSAEENTHAQMFADHLAARDVVPQIQTINAPQVSATSVVEVFEAALAHEELISDKIRNLAELGFEVKDYDSRPLIDSFLAEQVEEVATVKEILDRLRIVGDDGSGLLRIDAEMGTSRSAE